MNTENFTSRPSAHFASLIITATAITALASGEIGATELLECPATVRLTSPFIQGENLPSGTRILVDTRPLQLTGYNVFDGPPAQGAALIPHTDRPRHGKSIATWNFEGDFPYGKFLSCDYAGGTVRLVKRVNDVVKQCTSQSNVVNAQNPLQIKFQCS
ncbi:STY0301 family protein [Acidovorax sp. NPDC077693]|uniref:STY0301 family protein n=1 Tax=unclassified Acidovorax TaxID=2684926 RepID=UPI0037C7C8D0